MMRVLIADDEPLARRALLRLLQLEDDVQIVGECGDGETAVALVQRLRPDLLFLDIRMPEANGLEVAEAAGKGQAPAIVFVTAHDQYALRAFEVHAVDYLLKPFSSERLKKTLECVRRRISSGFDMRSVQTMLEELRHSQKERNYLQRIPVAVAGRVQLVPVKEIERVEALGNYARIFVRKQAFEVRETLSRLEQKLDPRQFVRIHRSTIVNVVFVQEVQSWFKGGHLVVMKDGSEVRLSRYQKNAIELLMGKR